jgi:hypothetical protein
MKIVGDIWCRRKMTIRLLRQGSIYRAYRICEKGFNLTLMSY